MKVTKHSGHVVEFDGQKLHNSLLRAGAGETVADDIVDAVRKQIFDGMSTKKIYQLAFSMLKKVSGSHAARYNLRTAIQQLGPAGFFFEKFVARLYSQLGYSAVTNLSLSGRCVTHEIDVVLEKDGVFTMVECKFHARRESISDVKVPMYILSRFNDLKDIEHPLFDGKHTFDKCLIVTNNRFSADALTFGRCNAIEMLSWDYPADTSLRNLIDRNRMYPVTCLTTLTAAEKEKLMILGIILAWEIADRTDELRTIGISDNRIRSILREISEL